MSVLLDSSLDVLQTTPVPKTSQSTVSRVEHNSADGVSCDKAVGYMPWYVGVSYTPQDLIMDDEGVVQAGTLEALVEELTTPNNVCHTASS